MPVQLWKSPTSPDTDLENGITTNRRRHWIAWPPRGRPLQRANRWSIAVAARRKLGGTSVGSTDEGGLWQLGRDSVHGTHARCRVQQSRPIDSWRGLRKLRHKRMGAKRRATAVGTRKRDHSTAYHGQASPCPVRRPDRLALPACQLSTTAISLKLA